MPQILRNSPWRARWGTISISQGKKCRGFCWSMGSLYHVWPVKERKDPWRRGSSRGRIMKIAVRANLLRPYLKSPNSRSILVEFGLAKQALKVVAQGGSGEFPMTRVGDIPSSSVTYLVQVQYHQGQNGLFSCEKYMWRMRKGTKTPKVAFYVSFHIWSGINFRKQNVWGDVSWNHNIWSGAHIMRLSQNQISQIMSG